MKEQPCVCIVVGAGYEKEGMTYRCQSCADGSCSRFDYSCCTVTEKSKEAK